MHTQSPRLLNLGQVTRGEQVSVDSSSDFVSEGISEGEQSRAVFAIC